MGSVSVTEIAFQDGAVCIDATVIAQGLGIEAASVQSLMRGGEITSLCEAGADEDAGRHRVTFFAEADGSVSSSMRRVRSSGSLSLTSATALCPPHCPKPVRNRSPDKAPSRFFSHGTPGDRNSQLQMAKWRSSHGSHEQESQDQGAKGR